MRFRLLSAIYHCCHAAAVPDTCPITRSSTTLASIRQRRKSSIRTPPNGQHYRARREAGAISVQFRKATVAAIVRPHAVLLAGTEYAIKSKHQNAIQLLCSVTKHCPTTALFLKSPPRPAEMHPIFGSWTPRRTPRYHGEPRVGSCCAATL